MRIKSSASRVYAGMTLASFGALGLPGTLLVGKIADGSATLLLYVLVAPFLVVGLILAYFGLREMFRRLRYGGWILECADGDGRFGHPLGVTVFPRRVVSPNGGLECRMRCIVAVGSATDSRVAGVPARRRQA